MIKYPECEKAEKIQKESQKIGEFLEWLTGEKNLTICEWMEQDDREVNEEDRYCPVHIDIEKLLAEFFGIDLNKIEQEKRQMLDKIRSDQ